MTSRNVRQELSFSLICPVSGMQIPGHPPVPAHRIPVALCVNGALYGTCRTHGARIFIRNFATVDLIVKNSVVVAMVSTNGERKEVKHGS